MTIHQEMVNYLSCACDISQLDLPEVCQWETSNKVPIEIQVT